MVRFLRAAIFGAIATGALLVPSSTLAQIDSLALSSARLKSDGNLVATLTIQCQPPWIFDFGAITVRQVRGSEQAEASSHLSDDLFETPCTGSIQNLDVTLTRTGSVRFHPGEATGTADVDVFSRDHGFAGKAIGPVSLSIRSVSPPVRMVGKGSVSGGGETAAYAYKLPCDAGASASPRFRIRFGQQHFRLTGVNSAVCTDDPAVSTPASAFDTLVGTGTGTLTTGGPGKVEWKFVDGGPGGASDWFSSRSATRPTRSSSKAAHRRQPRSLVPVSRPAATPQGRRTKGDSLCG